MNQIKELMKKEAEDCLNGGIIEGLSRFQQLYNDINMMQDCGFVDETTAKELREIVDERRENGTIADNSSRVNPIDFVSEKMKDYEVLRLSELYQLIKQKEDVLYDILEKLGVAENPDTYGDLYEWIYQQFSPVSDTDMPRLEEAFQKYNLQKLKSFL